MRTGLSTIQQTLTPEAATVLNQSIAEAGRRSHGQTTPLHVAATLLASPSGYFRQACIRSHPNSSHPLQCRALELCFSVALERLPTASPAVPEPPVSNALMAALKRAQAHQRKGCPEQQQQPLLAVKVELEQLVISILDDPSVSRVMREASFSSPAVKATIEQSLNSNPPPGNASIGIGYQSSMSPVPMPIPVVLPGRNSYVNPRLQQEQEQQQRSEGVVGTANPNLYLNPRLQQEKHRNEDSGGGNLNQNRYLNPRLQREKQRDEDGVGSSSRNLYLNPRLQQGNLDQSGGHRGDDVKRVIDILLRAKKRNPVLVGELEPEIVVKEILRKVENGEVLDGQMKNVEVISVGKDLEFDKGRIPAKIMELGSLIQGKFRGRNGISGVLLDLGDLKWLAEPPASGGITQQVVSETGREAVAEMGKLVERFGAESESGGKLWLLGTATCETYLRCQVHYPSMEAVWDLQAVPIAPRSTLPGTFPRMSTTGMLSSTLMSPNQMQSFNVVASVPGQTQANLHPARKALSCPDCSRNYDYELANLIKEFEIRSDEDNSDSCRPALPQWLRNAKVESGDDKRADQSQMKGHDLLLKQKTRELQSKWGETCLRLHPSFHQIPRPERIIVPTAAPVSGLCNPTLLLRPSVQPKLQPPRHLRETPQLKSNHQEVREVSDCPNIIPGSPVRTELALGPNSESPSRVKQDVAVKDLLSRMSSEPEFQKGKFANESDIDSFKKLLKGLMRKAWWQPEAASAVATTVTQCKLGEGRRQGDGKKDSLWLLFTGPDRVGKKKIASVLAEHVYGANPIMIYLGTRRDEEESDMGFRGKMGLDRIADAVRQNPFSVIVLVDIDEADALVRGNIKRAMERGRLTDSYGREIALGNVIFILTGNWSTVNYNEHSVNKVILNSIASGDWQLRLTVGEKRGKRRAHWIFDKERETRQRKDLNLGLSLDLNQAADVEEGTRDGSFNSSIIDQEDELGVEDSQFSVTSVPHDLVSSSDGAVVFKPVNFGLIRREIKRTITKVFSSTVDDTYPIEVEEDVLDKILGGLWFGKTTLEEWAEQVLIPSFRQLKEHLPCQMRDSGNEKLVVRLDSNVHSGTNCPKDLLPRKITVMVDEVRS